MTGTKCEGFLTMRLWRNGEIVIEEKNIPNFLLNNALNAGACLSSEFSSAIFSIFTYTSTSLNYRDVPGTWTQSGNTVTRTAGAGTGFLTSPSGIGNELQWNTGERCHFTARTSDTQITVSGPSRSITGTIREWFGNMNSTTGQVQLLSNITSGPVVTDYTAGTIQRTFTGLMGAAPSDYVLGSVQMSFGGGVASRIVLPVPVNVLQYDQLEFSYTTQTTTTNRAAKTVVLSSCIPGWPVKYQTSAISGNGTKVTVTTASAHHFIVGDEIEIVGAAPLKKTITSITSNPTTWTINATGHGLSVGNTVVIEDCSVTAYNGTHTVATTPTADQFTITNASNPGVASNGTVRLSTPATYFSGIQVVTGVPNSTTVEYNSTVTGPPVNPGLLLTSPDEATLINFGQYRTGSSGISFNIYVYNQANLPPDPSPTQQTGINTATYVPSYTYGTTSTWLSGESASYANDWTASSSRALSWPPGTSETRIKAFYFGNSSGGVMGDWGAFLRLRTAQPKLSTYRLAPPSFRKQITRELI